MGKCTKCGGGWFFSRQFADGLCKKCHPQIHLQKIYDRILVVKEEGLLIKNQLQLQHNKIRDSIKDLKEQEITATESLTFKELQVSRQKEELEANLGIAKILVAKQKEELYANLDLIKISVAKQISIMQKNILKVRPFYKAVEYSTLREELGSNILEHVIVAEEMLAPTVVLKLNCLNTRELRKAFNQNDNTIKKILEEYKSRYTTKANASIYSLMVIALEAELQNVIFNLRYAKLEQSELDIKSIIVKYQKIASDGNQSIAPTIKKFIGEIEYLFLEAIRIEYEYYVQKERIKEEQKTLKEQMKQEAAEKKLLEEQRKKVEQEEAKFLAELVKINTLLVEAQQEAQEDSRIIQLEERIQKVQEQLSEVEQNKEQIIHLQNGKAGYIYIISNLGSFGDNIFKVGMTRRIDPQDRIDELGSASVPFRFDVHSLIFSENAPDLETAIHKKLHDRRVNKVNLRKEFFNCDIDELESIVYDLEPTASFNRTMLAEQYNQGLSVGTVADSLCVE